MIRRARPEDARALSEVDRRVVAAGRGVVRTADQVDDESAFTVGILSVLDAGESERAMWVADVDRVVVGEATATRFGVALCRHVASLSVQVDPAFQGRGLGRELVAAVVEWATFHRIERLQLSVLGDNHRAIALYTSFGFVVEGVRWEFLRLPDGRRVDDLQMVRLQGRCAIAKAAAIVVRDDDPFVPGSSRGDARPGPPAGRLADPRRAPIEPGERPEDAVLREVAEETGLVCTEREPLGEWTQPGAGVRQRWHGFLVRAPEGTPDQWDHTASGSPEEDGLVFSFRWYPARRRRPPLPADLPGSHPPSGSPPMKRFTLDLAGPGFRLGHWRCDHDHRGPGEEQVSLGPTINVVLRGVYGRHVGRRTVIADPTVAVLANADDTWRSSHPTGCGDAGIRVILDPERAPVDPWNDRVRPLAPAAWLDWASLMHTADPEQALVLIANVLGFGRTLDREPAFVRRVRAILADRLRDPPSLEALAVEVGVSPWHLCRTFRTVTGATPAPTPSTSGSGPPRAGSTTAAPISQPWRSSSATRPTATSRRGSGRRSGGRPPRCGAQEADSAPGYRSVGTRPGGPMSPLAVLLAACTPDPATTPDTDGAEDTDEVEDTATPTSEPTGDTGTVPAAPVLVVSSAGPAKYPVRRRREAGGRRGGRGRRANRGRRAERRVGGLRRGPGTEYLRIDPRSLAILGVLVGDNPATPDDETGGLLNPDAAIFGPDGRLYV